MKKKNIILTTAFLAVLLTGCEKILDLDSGEVTLTEEEALQTKEDIYRLLNSTYDVLANTLGGQIQSVGELLSDNLQAPEKNDNMMEIYNHNTIIFNTYTGDIYANPYFAVFRSNRIREVMDNFDFTDGEKSQLLGEISFIRAYSHFEVLKLWAQPAGYTSDNSHLGIVFKNFTEFDVLPRDAVSSNYENIIDDLKVAVDNLPVNNGIYATKNAAHALLAKVYFQMGNYTLAAQEASEVINSQRYSLGTSVDRFLPDTIVPEAIFTLVSYYDGILQDTRSFAFTGNYKYGVGSTNPLLKGTIEFYNTYVIDTNDRRLDYFEVVNPGTPEEFVATTKFNEDYFNVPVLHLTDLKLLRAEALAEQGIDLGTAVQDVNDVRERAYGSTINNLLSTASASEIIEAARYERRIEMFGEGDRIQQLKRRGAINGESIAVRGDSWNCNGMVIQFPSSDQSEVFQLNPGGGCN